jgi:thiol-disulfide isomerase/thioredoxin
MMDRHGLTRMIVAALAAGAVLAGCGGAGGTATPDPVGEPSAGGRSTPPGTTEPAETSAPPVARVAVPDLLKFEGRTLEGAGFDARSLAGTPVVFWFWAPWCPKCASEAPNLAAIAEEYGDRVGFVGIAGLDQVSAMRDFVADRGVGGFVHLNDEQGLIWRKFEITVQSSIVFMKADGSSTRTEYDVLGAEELENRVRALLTT